MAYGLTNKDMIQILTAVRMFPDIEEVLIFGSRAKGNYKRSSDVDLAIKGKNISYQTVTRLSTILNEDLPLPYFFDVVHYESLSNPALRDHIDRVGITLETSVKSDNTVG